jgi:PAS domain S-box-containing protein
LKYGENSNTLIVTLSGNYNNMGTIINLNNEVTRVLGFSKSELFGQNVTRIQPKIFADFHDGLMKNYFETSVAKIVGLERLIFPVNKNSYMVPCSLMIKVLPNLEDGIKVVGFLKDLETGLTYGRTSDFDSDDRVNCSVNLHSRFIILCTAGIQE